MMKTVFGVDPRAAFWLPPVGGLHQLVRIEIHLRRKVAQSTSRKHLLSLWPSTIAALQMIGLNIGASKPSGQAWGVGQAARKGERVEARRACARSIVGVKWIGLVLSSAQASSSE
ncbi:hypothetical protein E1N52_02125 [Paraburkholderia guartelaensis]|uniref:Uncharacterized protein n=1 Tax=Paraburkholderia guartelaensis TaxID=2546446 RepID=A0A4R5LMG5_9BURK|nr:hypothetical protein [Paraburkholderia guartelaensis]TDG11069.1 hypothetical protein E1N52_02125 [Paraburkholderia guartelaensis]